MNQTITRNQMIVEMAVQAVISIISRHSSRRGPSLKISRQLRFISRASLPFFMGAWIIGLVGLIIR